MESRMLSKVSTELFNKTPVKHRNVQFKAMTLFLRRDYNITTSLIFVYIVFWINETKQRVRMSLVF